MVRVLPPRACYAVAALALIAVGAPAASAQAPECAVGIIDIIAGGRVADNGPATEATLYQPQGVAIGPDGSLYIADAGNCRVRTVDSTGRITTLAGSGQFGYSGDGGPAAMASLGRPTGVAVGRDGSVYIADAYSNRIRRVDRAGVITTVAGGGERGNLGNGGLAIDASLDEPRDVAVGPGGSVYIVDSYNQRIRKVDPAGVITTVAGSGARGFSGDGGPAVEASLFQPDGIGLGPDGSIYIADTHNERIRKVDPHGVISTVAGGAHPLRPGYGDGGPAVDATLSYPADVAVAADGTIYIAEHTNGRIRKVDPAGVITTIAGARPRTHGLRDGGPASEAPLYFPVSLALAADGSLYIADERSRRVRKIDPKGIITTVAGGAVGDGVAGREAAFHDLRGLAVGRDGSVYVADEGSNLIRRIGPDGIVTTVAGSGNEGDFGDGGPAVEAALSYPADAAVAADGTIYIADTRNNRVRKVDPNGVISTIAGSGVPRGSGDGGPAIKAGLEYPYALALAPDGSLYIAEEGKHRIRRVDANGVITTVAGNGEKGYSGDGGPATEASINRPRDVAIGPDGSIYIAEWSNHRVRKVDPGGIITTVAGNGEERYSGDNVPATQASLWYPAGVAVGQHASLYIADNGNWRVRKVDADGIITTAAGNGEWGDWSVGPATEANVNRPHAVAIGPQDCLYIAAHRVIQKVWWRPCDPQAAKASADELRAKAADSPDTWREIFELYLIAEAWEDALAAAQRVLAIAPPDNERARTRAEVLAARCYAAKRDDHEARRRLIPILARAQDGIVLREAADALVALYLVREERDQAIATLTDLRTRTQDQRLLGWINRRLRAIVGE